MICFKKFSEKWNSKSFRGPFVCFFSIIVYSLSCGSFFTFGEYVPALQKSISNKEAYLGTYDT